MCDKVIVLEIKEKYAIAMKADGGIVRIQHKNGLSVGDQIYILPEDIYHVEKPGVVVPFFGRQKEKQAQGKRNYNTSKIRQLSGIAAAIVLFISLLFFPKFQVPVYATVSFDGAASIQIEMDEKFNILSAVSPNHSVSSDQLAALKGKNLLTLGEEFQQFLGTNTVLVAYIPEKEAFDDKGFYQNVIQILPKQKVLFLSGDTDDMLGSSEKGLTIGKYMAGKMLTSDEAEALLDSIDYQELMQMLSEDETWMHVPEFQKILKERQEELLESAKDIKDELEDIEDDKAEEKDREDDIKDDTKDNIDDDDDDTESEITDDDDLFEDEDPKHSPLENDDKEETDGSDLEEDQETREEPDETMSDIEEDDIEGDDADDFEETED